MTRITWSLVHLPESPSARVLDATGKNNPLSFASISSAAGVPLSKDFAGIRMGLEKEKKEARKTIVDGFNGQGSTLSDPKSDRFPMFSIHHWLVQVRQIRSIESQLKWDMYREERSQTEEERREEAKKSWQPNVSQFV